MKFKTLMIIKAVVCLAFGIAFIFSPGKLLSIFGVTLNPGSIFPAREYGAALFGNLVLTWFARNASESVARLAIIRALFVYDAIGFVVTLMALSAGILNSLGWLVVVVYLFFTLGFGYFLIVKPDTKPEIAATT
jgi:hypothetical protein